MEGSVAWVSLSLSLSLSASRLRSYFCTLSDFVCAEFRIGGGQFGARILNPKYYFEGVCSVSSNAKQRANE